MNKYFYFTTLILVCLFLWVSVFFFLSGTIAGVVSFFAFFLTAISIIIGFEMVDS